MARRPIDAREALRLWLEYRNWRVVAEWMFREDGGPNFTPEAIRVAVWQYYRGQR
jgi:hypothetical protein